MEQDKSSIWVSALHQLLIFGGAALLTLAVFLVLPLIQQIGNPTQDDTLVRSVDVAALAPPPPEEPREEEPPPPPEAPTPELTEEAPPLDLSQLELALNPGLGDESFGDFRVDLSQLAAGGGAEELDKIFSIAELDQKPRAIFQRSPTYPAELHKRQKEGTVQIVFIVDTQGRVVDPQVRKSSDPAFERPALEAVRQWKFEPGTRNGDKVQFKMRVPITFNVG